MGSPESHPLGTILVVDDDPTLRAVIAEMLCAQEYRVLTAATGLEALEVLRSFEDEIRVVLLDLAMPGMDGVAVMRHLVNVHHIAVGVIVITGHSEFLGREEFFALGNETVMASQYITKPFSSASLLADVERTLKGVEKKRKVQQSTSESVVHARLDRIESVLNTLQRNQRGFVGELGMELMKVVVIAAALFLMLFFGIDDFARKISVK